MPSFRRLFVPLVLTLLTVPLAVPQAGAAGERDLLQDQAGTYPRVIQLQHNWLAKGRIISSVNGWSGRDGVGVIRESRDGGRSFQRIATIRDPAAAGGKGICCSSLFELPKRVGKLAKGTLLWADNVGFDAKDGTRTSLRLWASTDEGHSWSFLSTIATSPNRYKIWEPALELASDGSLVAFYSDETDKKRHDQKLVQVRSTDGKHWGGKRDTVTRDQRSARPGMANPLRLPNGHYLLVYEDCNIDRKHQCRATLRSSNDGWHYGNPRATGTVVRTADGKYPLHTPTIGWSPRPGKNGTVLLDSEMLANADGSDARGSGGTVLGNERLGAGKWYEMPAPAPTSRPTNGHCTNFSPSVAGLSGGARMIELATERVEGVCRTYYGTGDVPARG